MKKYLFTLAALAAFAAQASNYPPNYSWQTVRAVTYGPVLIASAASGSSGTYYAFGYKNSGVLAKTNPDHIDAVIWSTCTNPDGSQASKTSTVQLGREWHGTGYMSVAIQNLYSFYPQGCLWDAKKAPLQIAFSDAQGNWDSRFGSNYQLESLFGIDNVSTFETKEPNYWDKPINDKAWEFIIEQMRK